MARTATRSRLPALPMPVAAGACLAFAGANAGFAAFGVGAMRFGWFASGGAQFEIDPRRAAVLAPLLLAAAACGLAGRRDRGGSGWGWGGLVVAAVGSVLAVDLFTAVFWSLIAGTIVVVRRGGAFGLAALPAVAVMLALHQASGGFGPWFTAAGAGLLLACGGWAVWAARGADLARATAVGFAGLAFVDLGLGSGSAAIGAVVANAVVAPVIGLAADYLIEATGTDALDWLGGIARGMPRFAVLVLAGLGFAVVLPPGPGFAAFMASWGVAVAGGSWLVVIVLAMWFGAMGFAVVRAVGALCLGRPRSLRAAAAEDAPRPVLIGLALLVAGGVVLAGSDAALQGLALVMAVIGLAASRFLRRGGPIEVAGYEDGFARPPAWLPFGDPATQITATGFAAVGRWPARLGWVRVAGLGGAAWAARRLRR